MRVVVVGAGIAGTTAAEEIRKRDKDAHITLIGREYAPLYSRVLLPHYIKGKVKRDRVFLKSTDWYDEQNIEYMNGVEVRKIDTKNSFAATSEGREIPYDKMLLTSGGEARLIPADKRGVSYFRTIDDADHLVNLLNETRTLPKGEQRAAVFGGGFISLEYINVFALFDVTTTVIMRSEGFWSRMLSGRAQVILREHAQQNGVDVIVGEEVADLSGDAELAGVVLKSGREVPARIFGVGIGIETDLTWLRGTGVQTSNGILANAHLETDVKNVYTAGDVAEFFDVTVGRRVLLGNWMNAQTQARTVAKTITGERTQFELVSSYATHLLGKNVVFIGDTSREHADAFEEIAEDPGSSVELFKRDNKIVGAVMVGSVHDRQKITDAIKSGSYAIG